MSQGFIHACNKWAVAHIIFQDARRFDRAHIEYLSCESFLLSMHNTRFSTNVQTIYDQISASLLRELSHFLKKQIFTQMKTQQTPLQ